MIRWKTRDGITEYIDFNRRFLVTYINHAHHYVALVEGKHIGTYKRRWRARMACLWNAI